MAPRNQKQIDKILKNDLMNDASQMFYNHLDMFKKEYRPELKQNNPKKVLPAP